MVQKDGHKSLVVKVLVWRATVKAVYLTDYVPKWGRAMKGEDNEIILLGWLRYWGRLRFEQPPPAPPRLTHTPHSRGTRRTHTHSNNAVRRHWLADHALLANSSTRRRYCICTRESAITYSECVFIWTCVKQESCMWKCAHVELQSILVSDIMNVVLLK